MLLPAVLRAGGFFSLESAAEFYVPLMRASGAAKRTRPLFVQRAPIEPSSAIVRRSGTRGVVRRRFQISSAFPGRIKAYTRVTGHPRAPSRKTSDTTQRSQRCKTPPERFPEQNQ